MSAASMVDESIRQKNKIPALLNRIRNLKLMNRADIDEVSQITESMHSEWKKIKNKIKKKLIRNNLLIYKFYIVQEAEEEIIFGLMDLLNEKITSSLKKRK